MEITAERSMMTHDSMIGTIGGTLLSCVGMVTGFIQVEGILQVAVVAGVGATVSFFTTKLWNYLFKKEQ